MVAFFAIVIGIGLQAFCGAYLLSVFSFSLPWYVVLILFLLGIFFLSSGLAQFIQKKRDTHFWHYLGLNFFIPFYGALGSLVIALFRYLSKEKHADIYNVDEAYSFVKFKEDDEKEILFRRGSAERLINHELWVQSYFDIMRSPDRNLKKVLIGKIVREWTPNGVKLLRMALIDNDYDIRSYAATALSRVEDQLNNNLLELKKSLNKEPDNVLTKLKLAESYLYFCRTGIVDETLSEHYLKIAEGMLDEIEPAVKTNQDLWLDFLLLRGQIANLSGNTDKEKSIYEKILEINPQDTDTLAKLCSLQFEERNFSELKSSCHKLLGCIRGKNPLIESARLWTKETEKT